MMRVNINYEAFYRILPYLYLAICYHSRYGRDVYMEESYAYHLFCTPSGK